MKRLFVLFAFHLFSLSTHAQDTSKAKIDQEIVKIIGTLFNDAKGSILKDYRTNGDKTILGTALKEMMGGVAKRTKERVTKNGIPDFSVGLPALIEQNRSALISKGKSNLLKDFQSSIKQAAQQAMLNSLYTMVDNITDIDVNVLVDKIDDNNLSVTDLFQNAQKNKLVKIAKPFAKTAFKVAGGRKLYKQIDKTIKQSEGKKLKIDNEEFIAELATDLFFKALKDEENAIKKDPLRVLGNLLDFIK